MTNARAVPSVGQLTCVDGTGTVVGEGVWIEVDVGAEVGAEFNAEKALQAVSTRIRRMDV